MSKFEAVILLSPDLSSANLKKQEDSFKKLLIGLNGSVFSKEDWGLRNLNYKIKNFKKAFYKFYQLEIEGSKIQNIKKNINQNEQIIRHLFVKVKNHQDLEKKAGRSIPDWVSGIAQKRYNRIIIKYNKIVYTLNYG